MNFPSIIHISIEINHKTIAVCPPIINFTVPSTNDNPHLLSTPQIKWVGQHVYMDTKWVDESCSTQKFIEIYVYRWALRGQEQDERLWLPFWRWHSKKHTLFRAIIPMRPLSLSPNVSHIGIFPFRRPFNTHEWLSPHSAHLLRTRTKIPEIYPTQYILLGISQRNDSNQSTFQIR